MIKADETEIVGKWIEVDGSILGDQACQLAESLAKVYLMELGVSQEVGGWETLFRDPNDGRYWIRTYPHSDLHGGGPPALICLTENNARTKFPHLF